jgi:plastocyanin
VRRPGAGRVAVAAACLVIVASSATDAAASVRANAASAPQVSNLLVYAQEWSLWPSRGSLPAGGVAVELWNRGQDAHDLRIRRLNSGNKMVGPVLGSVQYTLPGKITKAYWRLRKPGRYELYCSLPGHAALGMVAKLTVKPDHG